MNSQYARTGFDMLRSESRTMFLPNELWEELLNQTLGICSVSEYVMMGRGGF